MDKRSRTVLRAGDRQIIAGIKKRLSNQTKITVAGVDYTPDELIAVFQGRLDAMDQTDSARGAYRGAVGKERTVHAQVRVVKKAFQGLVLATYGRNRALLGDFGFEPPKEAKKTAVVKLEATKKGKATREARHTMGPKQKKKVKGSKD